MPTSYTEGVANGKITEFADYALQCARNFGACILLRDEPLSSEIPVFEPSDYYQKSLEEAKQALIEFLSMDEVQRRALYAREREENTARADRELLVVEKIRDRYEAMLAKARAFECPSPDHENYAKFIVEQLESSIKWDCDTSYWNALKEGIPFEAWQSEKFERLSRSVVYYESSLRDEIDRVKSRNAWVRKLKESLGVAKVES